MRSHGAVDEGGAELFDDVVRERRNFITSTAAPLALACRAGAFEEWQGQQARGPRPANTRWDWRSGLSLSGRVGFWRRHRLRLMVVIAAHGLIVGEVFNDGDDGRLGFGWPLSPDPSPTGGGVPQTPSGVTPGRARGPQTLPLLDL
jgi:hypothetical protein